MMDAETKVWIRNSSDEKAAAACCRFDTNRGQKVCDWIESNCHLYEGSRQLMKLIPWQRDAIMRMFGWIRWEKKLPSGGEPRWIRRFTRASIWVPKKNGKSPFLAALALYLTCGDGESGNHFFFAAADGKQAGIAAKHAIEMVKSSPLLSDPDVCEINLTERKVTHLPSGSDMRPISSGDNRSARGQQGLNGSVGVDETHVVTSSFISESSIDQAGAARDEPFHIEVSTAGKDPDGYGKSQYDYGKQVENGDVTDQSLFFLCFEAPQNISDEEFHKDPVRYGKMANPSWGRTIQEHEYLAHYNRARRSLADFADFRTFRTNQWQYAASPWLHREDWLACRREFVAEMLRGCKCTAGLDLAYTRDTSAWVLCFAFDDRPEWFTEPMLTSVIVRPDLADAKIDRWYAFLFWFFMPERGVERLAVHVPQVREWVSEGLIVVTPGDATDYSFIETTATECAEQFSIDRLIYDDKFAEDITNRISTRTGIGRQKFAQTISEFNEPTQDFERLVITQHIAHNGNAFAAWQVGHCNVKTDANGNKRPVKPELASHKKIDGVVAAIQSFAGARLSENDGWDWYRATAGYKAVQSSGTNGKHVEA